MKRTLIVVMALGIAAAAAPWDPFVPTQGSQDPVPPAVIAQGKAIFEGKQAGALCFTCHGVDGKGVVGLAPNLTDSKWLHGDGSMTFLQKLIKEGVPKPKESAAPMPPMGGANLNAEQLRAVAAYVATLGKK